MATEYIEPAAPGLPLLLPPDPPSAHVYGTVGWRWKAGTTPPFTVLERRPQDDEHGAVVQWIVLRYHRDGVLRKTLAAEYGYSERQVQAYLSGSDRKSHKSHWWTAYAAPVLRALRRLGLPVDERSNQRKRHDAQARAARGALADLAHLLDGDERPEARRLQQDIRLLTVTTEDEHAR